MVLLFLARRIAYGALVVLAMAIAAYGGIRALRPELYGGEAWLSGTLHDVNRALLHLDFGGYCGPTCPTIHDEWAAGVLVDVTLLGGAILLGAVAARGVEAGAMLFYCAPPYVVALLALLVFDPYFGVLGVPFLVDPNRFGEPFTDVPGFLRGMLLPWVICAAPVAAACLRLTVAMTAEAMDEDYVRTALAKGLSRHTAIRRHAGPAARPVVVSYLGAAVPVILLNVVLVEFVFALPGFLKRTWHAFGKAPGLSTGIDYEMLQALAVWAAVLIVTGTILADTLLFTVDPRVRASGR
jgi:peptide/nickel transport system permease protein